MTEQDPAQLAADLAAARAELGLLRARTDPRTKVWTSTELGNMDHADYVEHEREIMHALREGRVVRDDLPAPADPADAWVEAQRSAAVDQFEADQTAHEARLDQNRRTGNGWR